MEKQFTTEAAWHSLAVGMYYRHQADTTQEFVRWESQTLAVKLHWQSKAKAALRTLGGDAMKTYSIHYSPARARKGLKPFAVFEEQVEPGFSRGISEHATREEAEKALAKLKEANRGQSS